MSFKDITTCLVSISAMMMFGSCSTFETPISRTLPTESLSTSDYQSAEISPSPYGTGKVDLLDKASLEKTALFDWPVDEARMTRGYLPNKRRPHWGIDLAAPRGTPILAAQSGTVIYAGREFSGYGRMVLVESPQGWATLYAHMDKILISEGQKVSQGQLLGAMGRSGRATGVHLHFEIRKDRGPIDPLPLLQRSPARVSSRS
jgi:murein DD-endopeptidase MepM/ murein hydrolase activator NlpD